jgi:hypothetical protein
VRYKYLQLLEGPTEQGHFVSKSLGSDDKPLEEGPPEMPPEVREEAQPEVRKGDSVQEPQQEVPSESGEVAQPDVDPGVYLCTVYVLRLCFRTKFTPEIMRRFMFSDKF